MSLGRRLRLGKINGEYMFTRIKQKIKDFLYGVSVSVHNLFHRKEKVIANDTKSQIRLQKRRKTAELLSIWSFLIIPIVDLIVFWVYGTIQSVPIAFEHYLTDGSKVYDFYNFTYLFRQFSAGGGLFIESLFNTLKYFSFSFFLLTPISIAMSYFIWKKIWGYKFFRYVFFFPGIRSGVILAAFFKALFGDGGQMQIIWEKVFGIKDVLFLADSKYAFNTMLFYNFYFGLCGNFLYWLAAYNRIPIDVIEAGQLDGTTPVTEFIHIVLPIVGPFILTMMMLMFTGIFSAGGHALLLTGGSYGTYDLGYYEYVLTATMTKADQGIGGALGLLKGVIILPIALVIHKLINKIETVEF